MSKKTKHRFVRSENRHYTPVAHRWIKVEEIWTRRQATEDRVIMIANLGLLRSPSATTVSSTCSFSRNWEQDGQNGKATQNHATRQSKPEHPRHCFLTHAHANGESIGNTLAAEARLCSMKVQLPGHCKNQQDRSHSGSHHNLQPAVGRSFISVVQF